MGPISYWVFRETGPRCEIKRLKTELTKYENKIRCTKLIEIAVWQQYELSLTTCILSRSKLLL